MASAPAPTPPPTSERCQGQILEYWAEEFYFQHILPACEPADSNSGAVCVLNTDGSACNAAGDNCVYTAGSERIGDEWAYNRGGDSTPPNGGNGGYCTSDNDCPTRGSRSFGFSNHWGGIEQPVLTRRIWFKLRHFLLVLAGRALPSV